MPDGVTLRGQSFPSGPDWVVMLHDIGDDLDCWRPLVGPVSAAGFGVASVDLRGHGASDGEPDEERVLLDVPAILSGVRTDVHGALIVIGAGQVGAALLGELFKVRPDALILFSPSPRERPWTDMRGEGIPKLFFVGAADAESDGAVRKLRNRSLGHAGVVSFPTQDQGAGLLREPWVSHIVEHVVGFARGVASAGQITNSSGGRA